MFMVKKSTVKIENVRIIRPQIVEQSPRLVQFLYGVTTLRDTWIANRGAARQWNSRQRRNLIDFHDQTAQQRQYFRKMSFQDFGAMWSVACARITCLIRNARPSYLEKIKYMHGKPTRFEQCFRFQCFGLENRPWTSKTHRSYERNSSSNRPCWCNFSTV